ncbi:S8 family peptidase [Acetobacterium woodii]|uniref:Serine proteinase n=1 Tax=Acetobacterium woodii (strain ATCC 29683 / DSM 1030 / JCM 2381 / KCTC 1655 / WB1) TaxID=931626 RepID=H6LEM7_ACEWD|nr:S8 family serine peptidase [Acetobacterium woodii]AFA48130.1 serine proteinase [Acetobacterium woodii DSM 1030]
MKTIKKLINVLVSAVFIISFTSTGLVAYAASNNNYPNDPNLGTSWQYAKVGVDNTWNAVNTKNEIVVAVLDTGLDVNLSDLEGRITNGYDFIENSSDMIDTAGHGTMVSSCIAAVANNGIGIAGSAGTANVKIAPYRIGDKKLDNDAIHAALIDAANREDVRIINLSFGSNEYNASQAEAIAYAISKGKIIIACSGNHGAEVDGVDPYYYPASYPGVISVGAMDLKGEIAAFSQNNDAVDLYAPGESIMVLLPDNRIGWQNGTSFSAAIVSGICADLLAQDPSLTAADVESLLRETAVTFGETNQAGLVQADKALETLQSRMNLTYAQVYTSVAINLLQMR